MRINDSREHGGIGILPLQDFTGGLELSARHVVVAARKVGREESPGQLGRIIVQRGSAGDLLGGFMWPESGRGIPAWGFVFGAKTTRSGTEDGIGLPTGGGGSGAHPSPMLPVRGRDWAHDTRFAASISTAPKGWNQSPAGWYGLVVAGTSETAQVEHFHPTDPRMPLVHWDGEPRCSAVACDLDSDSAPAPDRHARISSALRVLRKPSNAPKESNAVAFMLCESGQGDVRGGYGFDVWDSDASKARIDSTVRTVTTTRTSTEPSLRGGGILGEVSSVVTRTSVRTRRTSTSTLEVETAGKGKPETVIGMLGKRDGGPLDTGPSTDKHRIGSDADGNAINPFHISTDAYFRMDQRQDARILFESRPWPVDAKDYDERALCHLSYRADMDRWMIWTSFPMGDEVRVTETRTLARPTVTRPEFPPRRRGGDGIAGSSGDTGEDDGYFSEGETPDVMDTGSGLRPAISMRREMMLPGVSFRPQRIAAGEYDWRYSSAISPLDMRERHSDTTPVTVRMEGYGAQGAGGGWSYAEQPGSSRHRGGTAAGGVAFLPPEIDMSHALESFAPGGVTQSTAHVVAAPGVRWAAGTPDTTSGGAKDGWSWYVDGTDLVFSRLDSSGGESELLRLYADGHLRIAERTGDPSATPSGGGFLYVKSGGLYWKGSGATVTEIASA